MKPNMLTMAETALRARDGRDALFRRNPKFFVFFFFFYHLNDLIQRIKGFFCGEAKLVVDWKQHQSLIILCLCTAVCLYLIAVIWIRDNNLEYCCNLPINAAFGSRSRWEHWLSGCVARCFILTFYSTGRRFYDVKRRGRKQEQQQERMRTRRSVAVPRKYCGWLAIKRDAQIREGCKSPELNTMRISQIWM